MPTLENEHFSLTVDDGGLLVGLRAGPDGPELVAEPRLAGGFRLLMPYDDLACHYVDARDQRPAAVELSGNRLTIVCDGLAGDRGPLDVRAQFAIELDGPELSFTCRVENDSPLPLAELWWPRLGGLRPTGPLRDAVWTVPAIAAPRQHRLFRKFPGSHGFGAEFAEWSDLYPGTCMPWRHLWQSEGDRGLLFAYLDTTCRLSSWHWAVSPTMAPGGCLLDADAAAGEPVGLTFSHVRFPFTGRGQVFDSGRFVLLSHQGDWHAGADWYGQWFRRHFPVPSQPSAVRRHHVWFTSIIYQPEDRVVADYETYGQWCDQAREFGVNCFELIGWDRGGLERDYPQYEPEPKLGGREGLARLLRSIQDRGGLCLVFVNFNILDSATQWYRDELHKHRAHDAFGGQGIWMNWGESTLSARKGINVRRHVLATPSRRMEEILEGYFLDLVKLGARAVQIDKVVANDYQGMLDFNPLGEATPDTSLGEALIRSTQRVLDRCRQEAPDFCAASEAGLDRYIPLAEVFYRAASTEDISPLRYVFPEWTACMHVGGPQDRHIINAAVMTGAVVCVEPFTYQRSLADPLFRELADYLHGVNRLRDELTDVIFLGRYLDTIGGAVTLAGESTDRDAPTSEPGRAGPLRFRVHADRDDGRRAIVVVNTGEAAVEYQAEFLGWTPGSLQLHQVGGGPSELAADAMLRLDAGSLHVIVGRR